MFIRVYACGTIGNIIQSNVIHDAMGSDLTASDCDIVDGSTPSMPGAEEANVRGSLFMGALCVCVWGGGGGGSEIRSTEVLTGSGKKGNFYMSKVESIQRRQFASCDLLPKASDMGLSNGTLSNGGRVKWCTEIHTERWLVEKSSEMKC